MRVCETRQKTNVGSTMDNVLNARGTAVLDSPSLNKGTGFTFTQRERLGLRGLLPRKYETVEVQVKRAWTQLNAFQDNMNRYIFLENLHMQNERLFYRVLVEHLEDLMPIVYTPTVGEACLNFDALYRNRCGMYFTRKDSGVMRRMLDNWPSDDVEIIVVTDGGRVLGLGDLGTNGMAISVGKVSLYVASGGFDPAKSMPVCLDLGTNNENLRSHDYYLGADEPRLSGDAHLAVVTEFCLAVKDKWPNCLIQFEDFKTEDAFRLLESLRHKVLCFNDDIQGTGATILAGLINALRAQGTPIKEARIIFFGAGSSAIGVATQITHLLMSEGLSEVEAKRAIWLMDSKGLITDQRDNFQALSVQKKLFAQVGVEPCDDLGELIDRVKPHALFGLSGFGPVFTREHIESLCDHIGKPIVFPLSNPTEKAEITAFDAYTWSKGKCLFAAGSPFDPVTIDGKTHTPGQGNNMFIFPGVGFASVSIKAREVPDSFFLCAAKALAAILPDEDVKKGTIYPPVSRIREISRHVAVAVANHAYDIDMAQLHPKPGDMEAFISERMYFPMEDGSV